MFTNVLAATDRVSVQDAAVVTAARLAGANSAKLHIIHVLESASRKNRDIVRHYRTGEEMPATSDYRKNVRKQISESCAGELPDGETCRVEVATGFPWHEISRYARRIRADLIVMGPHSSKAEEKGVVRVSGKIGSSVEGVLMWERCPVMIVNRPSSTEQLKFKRILVGIDFSMSCKSALRFAARLSCALKAKTTLFHMVPVPPDTRYSQDNYESDVKSANRRLRDLCRDEIKDVDHEYRVWGGALPHEEILRCAEKTDADLIVMGSHTKEQKGKWYPGNAVERVSFRSACPVISITDPEVLRSLEDISI